MQFSGPYLAPTVIYGIAHLFGLTAIGLIVSWMCYDGKGFALRSDPKLEFKWHPICMSLSLLFLNGEAIMIYRGLRDVKKVYTKAVHGILHCIAFTIMVLGLKAVWDSHDYNYTGTVDNVTPMPNLQSCHSWIGLSCATFYGCQLLAGFVAFYVPQTPLHIRQAVMPFHRTGGLIIFAFCLAAALMGAAEKAAWAVNCPKEYGNDICPEKFIVDFFSLAVLGYGVCVFLLATIHAWIRQPLHSELVGQSATVPGNGITSEVHFVHTERVSRGY
ncbi:unnamed protein product [Bursaphelenchus okinawaensis]|uniref:Cytochrome b561 domain-containing protein n=1 Tax=Bursaphelenchus okinawaensis TaxID=465554 RepID=A0A811LK15_9BILA|nr:unnamed protein product [Bursaphelenchus okinawaensis]CAG9125115.1 unnamed protein product [Bursaphelenchus okinawaensis]